MKRSDFTSNMRFFLILAGVLAASSCASTPTWMQTVLGRSGPSSEELAISQAVHRERAQWAIEDAVRRRDLTLGMSQVQVRQAWGDPRQIEVAGNPESGNERWIYTLGVSSSWSLQPRKIVYFDRGWVAGWETVHSP